MPDLFDKVCKICIGMLVSFLVVQTVNLIMIIIGYKGC